MQQFRMILAVVLSMAVLLAYSHFFAPPPLPPQSSQKQIQTVQKTEKESSSPVEEFRKNVHLIPSNASDSTPSLIIENDDVRATFSSQGTLTSLALKKFHALGSSTQSTDLLKDEGMALQLTVGEKDRDISNNYHLVEDKTEEGKRTLVYENQSDFLQIRKRYVFGDVKESHSFDVFIEIVNKGNQETDMTPRLWISRQQKKVEERKGLFSFLKKPPDFFEPLIFLNNSLQHGLNWDKLPPKTEVEGKIYWTGLSDRYFLLSLMARQESDALSVAYGREENEIYTSLSYGSLTLKPGEKVERRYSAYFGPKKRENLEQLGVNLEKSVDYGWFEFMAIPLLWFLIHLENFLGNWGLAILALTFIIKMILHPVNKKSIQSMKAMQKLQPRLAEIREKYKDNREKLNTEMMLLFKTHKVNPMGGCLPMILQMPVYIALYKVLWNAVELYQAPFFWIYKDLSAPDPFMLTPILLAIFMVLQQKFTPQTTMDPAQQKMMMFMPLMFAGFMIFLPFGLVLYILVNTVMSVVQQYMVQHDMSFTDIFRKLKKA